MTSGTVQHPHDNNFLKTIRTALAPEITAPRTKEDCPGIFSGSDSKALLERIASRNDMDHSGLVQMFTQNAELLNLAVHRAKDTQDAAEIIIDIARRSRPEFSDAKHIIQHHHPLLHDLDLWYKFAHDTISVHTTFADDPKLVEKTRSSFIGITVADWAIAESATLIHLTRPGNPRSTSLVPSIHIGIVKKNTLLQSLEEAYAIFHRQGIPNSMTFISGPSKTADIEAHMVHGAHGPREMHAIFLD